MNIVGCVSLSPDTRRRYVAEVESGIRIFDWLELGRWELPAATVACAVTSLDRVSISRSKHMARLSLGSVRNRRSVTSVPVVNVCDQADAVLSPLEGELYLGFASSDDGACCVGVDPLGLFPLYYYSTPDFFLFSSSLWPFGKHPGVSSRLDLDGLIGILVSQGIVGGRTLWEGVTRLSPGAAVTWRPGQQATERRVNAVLPTTGLFNTSFDDQIDAVDTALRRATVREPSEMMLLSGGLDSRLLAGYLSTEPPVERDAVSLGVADQFDVDFAARVSQRLAWRHRAIPVDRSHFAEHAMIQVRHEQLGGSFWDLAFWQLVRDLHLRDPVIVSGFCGNNILEPLRHDPRQKEFTFEHAFRQCNQYGLAPATLRALLTKPDVDERTEAVIDRLRAEYEGYDCEPFQKALMFDLTHRARFLVGTVVWRLSFGLRPTLPYADRNVLATALSLPMTPFRGRRLQKTLLCRRFPDLARLPLDTASFFTRPLLPTVGDRCRHLFLLFQQAFFSRRERRYYHSVFDLNGSGWREVRRDAETSRSKVESFLDRETLLQLLPPPEATIRNGGAHFFHTGSRQKSLLALLLWASEHL